eukprot:CAMPEP_0176093622 /NCGR_PEP_ID=MMETSP0120_2-20121206/46914_1 /TAXON_ID=160619 /ORGANISM="Kryptoperidinium foliaceum, Strain CCMP 1326" /LENGTH=69 /DNA_ID=CAMNT_0017427561 /DNA_START=62 /DNA_END=273 /DNA_ORIENTATION=+
MCTDAHSDPPMTVGRAAGGVAPLKTSALNHPLRNGLAELTPGKMDADKKHLAAAAATGCDPVQRSLAVH